MAVQKRWDKYEAALLLDFYLQYVDGKLPRKEAIQTVSARLRTMAKNNNIDTDDTYRNINGITFQMFSMESAYKGYTIIKPASKLFDETVMLYKTDRKEFDKLLREAMSMSDELKHNNQDEYLTWLSQKVSAARLSELYMMYEIIDKFCTKRKILQTPILQTTELAKVKAAQRELEQNKVFKFSYKRELGGIFVAIRYYIAYLKEYQETKIENNSTVVIESEKKSVDQSVTNSVIAADIEKNNKNETKNTIKTISFSDTDDLSYTHPVYASYFEDEIQDVSSWKKLYVGIFKKLYEDYADRIPINKSFNVINGRCDFCTKENYTLMSDPREIDDEKYLETNLSATDIVRKLKYILDICLVDYENVILKYENVIIKHENIENNKPTEPNDCQAPVAKNVNAENFREWLYKAQGKPAYICRSYVFAINNAERYARNKGFSNCKLYTDNYNEAKLTADELFNDKAFAKYVDQPYNRFRLGINNLLLYIKYTEDTKNPEKTENTKKIENPEKTENTISLLTDFTDLEPFIEILTDRFPKGYRITSPLELRKFKKYWEEIHKNPLDSDDETITNCIKSCGIEYDEKIYMPQKMLDSDTKMKLFSYINNSFQEGKKVIYYEALFKEFSDDFLDHCMYSSSMLEAYLKHMSDGSYHIDKKFISKDANVSANPYDEIKNCLIQQAIPMEYNEIFTVLSHIPEQKIKTILSQNDEFISNGRGEWFHISIVALSDDELNDIASIIQYSIDDKHFISGHELIDSIKKKYPYIVEQNSLLSDKGLRDAIGYKLRKRFFFRGNIISSKGKAISMTEVFADFCKRKDSFTLDELKVLKQELDTAIYFEAVYENSLRISKNEFVAKSYAAFKPDETDAVIDRFCEGDYIAIGKIKQFGLFPDAGFNWNSFLLEHYVAMYSPNYKLVHSNYNESVCVGGIVKKLSDIDTLDELIIDALAKSGLSLQKEEALQYLCDEGYLARRSYSGIEQLLIKAKELRNQRGY